MFKIFRNIVNRIVLLVRFGKRIKIKALSRTHLLPKLYVESEGKIEIGEKFMTEKNVSVESYSKGKIHIGNNVFLNSNVKIVARNRITIGNNTVIAPNVCIYDHDHNWHGQDMQGEFVSDEIVIGKNIWIGANSVILRGSKIGDGAVIAAGSVVKGMVEAETLFYQDRVNKTKKLVKKG